MDFQEYEFPTLDTEHVDYHFWHIAGCGSHLIAVRLWLCALEVPGPFLLVWPGIGIHHAAAPGDADPAVYSVSQNWLVEYLSAAYRACLVWRWRAQHLLTAPVLYANST